MARTLATATNLHLVRAMTAAFCTPGQYTARVFVAPRFLTERVLPFESEVSHLGRQKTLRGRWTHSCQEMPWSSRLLLIRVMSEWSRICALTLERVANDRGMADNATPGAFVSVVVTYRAAQALLHQLEKHKPKAKAPLQSNGNIATDEDAASCNRENQLRLGRIKSTHCPPVLSASFRR